MTVTAPAPGSPEWLKYMTASKIAAVVGTSPYESRFSLWHKMNGSLEAEAQTPQMGVGHVLEPALLAWFQSQHPEYVVVPGRFEVHHLTSWAGATPDGYALDVGTDSIGAIVEAKTARDGWEWRDDQIPAGYYDQVQWQMWVSQVDVTFVAALVNMELVERRVERDTTRISELVRAAEEFMGSLDRGEAPPLDGSMHTYQAVRELHPDIDPEDVEIPESLAVGWLDAREVQAEAAALEQQYKNEIADLTGNARRAVWNGNTLFTRQSRGGGTPYLVAARNLPTSGVAA